MKVRIISAVVAFLIVFPFVYFGGAIFAIGMGILSILAYYEILCLKKSHKEIPIIPSILAMICLLLMVFTNFNGENFLYGSTYVHLILVSLLLLIPTIFYKDDQYQIKDAFFLIGTIVFLGLAFNSFILVREEGFNTFLYLVSIPIITDSAAYFIGRKFGKKKLCPKISPNKSWEGAIGGFIFGTILPSLLYLLLFKKFGIKIIIATMILSTIGQMGDLVLSKLKRENDIKDFSNLMPGHGGALDRVDSTIVIFMTYVILSYIFL